MSPHAESMQRRRMTIAIDQAELDAAEAVLGTRGATATVNAALAAAVRSDRLRRLARRRFPDFGPEDLDRLRREGTDQWSS